MIHQETHGVFLQSANILSSGQLTSRNSNGLEGGRQKNGLYLHPYSVKRYDYILYFVDIKIHNISFTRQSCENELSVIIFVFSLTAPIFSIRKRILTLKVA